MELIKCKILYSKTRLWNSKDQKYSCGKLPRIFTRYALRHAMKGGSLDDIKLTAYWITLDSFIRAGQ